MVAQQVTFNLTFSHKFFLPHSLSLSQLSKIFFTFKKIPPYFNLEITTFSDEWPCGWLHCLPSHTASTWCRWYISFGTPVLHCQFTKLCSIPVSPGPHHPYTWAWDRCTSAAAPWRARQARSTVTQVRETLQQCLLQFWVTKGLNLMMAVSLAPSELRSISLHMLPGKEPTCQCRRHKRHRFDPWVGKIPWRRKWHPTSVFLPGKSHGQRSLEVYSLWGHRESDTTKCLGVYVLHFLTSFGESLKL